MKLLGLYINIPWPTKRYKYHDFKFPEYKKKINEKKYIHHLLQDLKKDSLLVPNRTINTIFIGGIAPNFFKLTSIKYLLKKIKNIIPISKNAENTIEFHISKLSEKKIFYYKKFGINRFSIRIQTFDQKKFNSLSKVHISKNILHKIKKINIEKFKNINLDLIYGLPKQSLQEALLDLKTAISLKPNHISWCEFYIEKNNNNYKNLSKSCNLNIIWKIFLQGEKLLKKSGYKKYEISSYSKTNYQCLHNLNYWKFGDYLGIGCNAHGKITQKNGKIIKTIKNKNLKKFMNGKYTYKNHIISKKNLSLEFFMNRLRLNTPIYRKDFKKYTYISEFYIKNEIKQAIEQNYLIETKKYWKMTSKGIQFLDSLLEIFIT
ncbi:putative oxidase [Buchnera aphidicola str. Bp (Baizongia pistaciae)]|uniref:Putative heme chaperone HemW-like protein n=1 Tax=Buchnera aphidicola subsp. Baizongia pistaciae (strain Bp) TaxID=224915 RepID=HEMWL_BUCBP|nr:radical SAM family heme chaperone HemW [Buchnera aphidicola]Q89A47.1 RecName: Full=Putative heme chaperone HemW-like protein [Buchnera aphidicola str. Bp (Baizongia pistaciae)]AAO27203.1 putative oxidase [Buchnera aphidicola str. Bp (Baizongia pistaciae)]